MIASNGQIINVDAQCELALRNRPTLSCYRYELSMSIKIKPYMEIQHFVYTISSILIHS